MAAAAAAAAHHPQAAQAAAGPLGMLPPQHAAAMQTAMAALASGQHPQLLEAVSGKMGVAPDQLRQTAAAIAAGESNAIPAEVVQQAMQLQWALRQGALPPMGAAAAAAVPPGLPPGLLGDGMPGVPAGAAAAAAAAGSMHSMPGMPPGAAGPPAGAPPAAGGWLLLDGEEQQGCIELYRRAYGRHLDLVYPPIFLAAAALALSSGAVPFWAALLLLPLCFVLGLRFIVVAGGAGAFEGRAVGVAESSQKRALRSCLRGHCWGHLTWLVHCKHVASKRPQGTSCATHLPLSACPCLPCTSPSRRFRHAAQPAGLLALPRRHGGQPGGDGCGHFLPPGKHRCWPVGASKPAVQQLPVAPRSSVVK